MILQLLGIALGLFLLIGGANALVKGSVRVALSWGMTPLVAGLTVAAFGTSSPELVVSVRAAVEGSGGLAIGNVIGSNICNIALILGVCAIIRPINIHSQVVRLDVPLMIGVTALLVVFLWGGSVGRLEGAVLIGLMVLYLVWSLHVARKSGAGDGERPENARARPFDYVLIGGGILLLIVGGTFFVAGATEFARQIGVSEAVIGLSMVALGTSLPELATSIVAALRGEADVAVGNVVGSNIFNILGILGLAALIVPLNAGAIQPRDLIVLVIVSVLVLPLVRSGFTLTRLEGGVLLVGYVAYMVWLFAAGGA